MIFNILENERQRLLQLQEQYKREIADLPIGSLSRKRRWNREYYYLAYRDSEKVKFDYIGPSNSKAVQIIEQKIKQRKTLQQKLRRVKENLRDVERSLRGQR